MNEIEYREILTCECGGTYQYDGYNNIEIEEGFFIIKGDCRCDKCNKYKTYEETHRINYELLYNLELQDIEEE